jgi:hypothetical protein
MAPQLSKEFIMFHDAIFAGAGFLVGCFTPAIGRKVKAFFVKETSAVKADVAKDAQAAAKKL